MARRFVPLLAAVVLISGCAGGPLSANGTYHQDTLLQDRALQQRTLSGRTVVGRPFEDGALVVKPSTLDDRTARYRLLDINPRPVADLSAVEIGLARFFLGVGLGLAYPNNLSLSSGTTFELSTAFDIAETVTIEIMPWGLWSLPDHPMPGADSALEMQPLLATLQIRLWEGSSGRAYIGGGGGYSWNNYSLGSTHRAAVMNALGLSSYSVAVGDGWLTHLVGGWEWYSTSDAKLNLGLELRYVMGQVDMTQYLEASTKTDVIDLGVYTFRVSLTGHF